MSAVEMGIAWFTEEQWPAYRRLMVDETDEFYSDWRAKAEDLVQRLKKEGALVRKVPVDISEFELWCRASKKAFDSSARAAYVQHLLEKKA